MNIHEQKYRIHKENARPKVCIPISALVLKVRVLAGDTFERDISCDSTYMLAAIDRVGKSLRQKMW